MVVVTRAARGEELAQERAPALARTLRDLGAVLRGQVVVVPDKHAVARRVVRKLPAEAPMACPISAACQHVASTAREVRCGRWYSR